MENENSTNLLDKFFSMNEITTDLFHVTGIYCFYYNGTPIYIGQAVDIYNRMKLHRFDYRKYCGYVLDPNVTIERVVEFIKDFKDNAPTVVDEAATTGQTEESEAKKVRIGSRKLYEFICQIPEGNYASEANIFKDAIKIKVLRLCERSELNQLEEDEIKENNTFVIHRNDGLNKFACNLTKGGDTPPHPTKISFEEANFIRKLAAEKDVYHMNVEKEKAFVAEMCDLFKIKNVQTDNPDDNYIRRILRNKYKRNYGPSRFVTEEQLKAAHFTADEIDYFRSCKNAWTDLGKWDREAKLATTKSIITYAEVYQNVKVEWRNKSIIEPPLEVFGSKDSKVSCDQVIKDWLSKYKVPGTYGDPNQNVQELRRHFRNIGPDKITSMVGGYYWRGIAIENPSYDSKHRNYIKKENENLTVDEAFGSPYSNNLDISKALENKDYCISLIKDFYGYDGPIETGGFYILPDGTAVKSANHMDVDNLLIRYHYINRLDREPMQYGDGSQFMDAINCVRIRRRGGRDAWILPYMILPEKQLTAAQYNVIENWIKFVLEKSHELSIQTLDNQSKVFKASQYSYFDVIDSIKLYYRAHILEDLREDYEIIFDDNKSESTDYFDQFDSDSLLEFIDEPTYTSIKPGDIIISKLVQRNYDNSHDIRPLLVINKSETDVYGFYITSTNSNLNMDFYKIELDDWSNEGLKKPSYVNLAEEKNTKAKFIIGPNPVVGHISAHDLAKIIEHLSDIYCVRRYPFKYNIGLTLNNLRKIS